MALTKSTQSLLGVGIYTAAEAARLLAVPSSTLRRWLRGYTYVLASGTAKRGRPVVRSGRDAETPVTFLDLVELLIVNGFRQHGVSLTKIRIAAETAASLLETAHPLAYERLKTDGREIFAELEEAQARIGLISLTSRGQKAFPETVERYLTELDYDLETRLVARWWPAGKNRPIVIDPRISFGAPHIAGTGVPTESLREPVEAGQKPGEVADWFGLEVEQVKAAVAYEEQLLAA